MAKKAEPIGFVLEQDGHRMRLVDGELVASESYTLFPPENTPEFFLLAHDCDIVGVYDIIEVYGPEVEG